MFVIGKVSIKALIYFGRVKLIMQHDRHNYDIDRAALVVSTSYVTARDTHMSMYKLVVNLGQTATAVF